MDLSCCKETTSAAFSFFRVNRRAAWPMQYNIFLCRFLPATLTGTSVIWNNWKIKRSSKISPENVEYYPMSFVYVDVRWHCFPALDLSAFSCFWMPWTTDLKADPWGTIFPATSECPMMFSMHVPSSSFVAWMCSCIGGALGYTWLSYLCHNHPINPFGIGQMFYNYPESFQATASRWALDSECCCTWCRKNDPLPRAPWLK